MNVQELEIEHDIDTGRIKIWRKVYEHGFINGPGLDLLVETDDLDHALLALRSILLNP